MHIVKMHGCGNDFVFVKYEENVNYSELAIKLCNRNIGVGGDGLIAVKTDPLEMIYYNADGSRAPMCGNGIRCFALYCYYNKLVNSDVFNVVTLAGIMKIEIVSKDPFYVKVNMGKAIYSNELIKALDDKSFKGRSINLCGVDVLLYSLFLGTIHTVIFVKDFNDPVIKYAKELCEHELFKEKTNVNFVQINSRDEMSVLTYERGCGFTLACGTGCCASVYVSNELNLVDNKCSVNLKYGVLNIEVLDDVYMSGPAKIVFESDVDLC